MDDSTVSDNIDPDLDFDLDDDFYLEDDFDPVKAHYEACIDAYRRRFDEDLDDYRRRFEAGNGAALLGAIAFCGARHIVMPTWLVNAFMHRWIRWDTFGSQTLDEALGVEWPKRMRLDAQAQYSRIRTFVFLRIQDERKKGRAVDEGLFEEIGEEFGIGKTLTSEYYYQTKKRPYTREEMFDKKD